MLPLRRKTDTHRARTGPDRPDWERDLPTGRPVFSAEVHTAAEIVHLHRAAQPDEPDPNGPPEAA